MIVLSALVGYVIGSIPTADWLARAAGHDLRSSGTGNPGTANAIGVAGRNLGLSILAIDFAKGAAAVVAGRILAGDAGGMFAAVAVAAGQILNPWFRFRGGKGLGVSGGAALIVWPSMLPIMAPTLIVAVRVTGAAARGTLLTIAVFVATAVVWTAADLPTWWGVDPTWGLVGYAIALGLLVTPKFVFDLTRRSTPVGSRLPGGS